MNNRKIYILAIIIFLLTINSVYALQSLLSQVYCAVLGDTDASPQYSHLMHKALRDFGVERPENVAIKQMNSDGPAFARLPLSSFTAFGIWINEEYFNWMDHNVRDFQIYHESAHYALHHHAKLLAALALAIPISSLSLAILHSVLTWIGWSCRTKFISLGAASLVALIMLYLSTLPRFVKYQEKQADLAAAEQLMKSNRTDILDAYINNLKKYDPDSQSIWWYSPLEQISYLQEIKERYNHS